MEWKRNIVRLGTRIVIIHISYKHAANLHWTFINIARCFCERCQIMDTYEECLYCQEIASISDLKKLNCFSKYDGFWGEIVLSKQWSSGNIYVWFCWKRSRPLDDNYIDPIHESWLHMQDSNKTKALLCMLTVKWPFSHVETVNIMALLVCSTSLTL